MKHLIFKIDGQSLVRRDSFKSATDSVEYLTVSFEFPSDWSGTTKKANFRKGDKLYPAIVKSDNTCIVPYEVLVRDTVKGVLGKQYFYMSVEGVNGTRKITTDEVKIEIIPSGTGEVTTPSEPTPDVFAQYVDDVKAQTKANADNAQQSAENAEASAQSAEESARSLKNDYSNALKGYASGSVVRVDDVSPVEHYPSVKIRGANLINYPYDQMGGESAGVTYTVNADGSVTVKGTATANAPLYLARSLKGIKGTVFLSGCPSGGSTSRPGYSLRLNKYVNGVEVTGGADIGNGNKITLNGEEIRVYIVVLAGTTVDVTFYPMLNYGDTAEPFTLFNPVNALVSRYGKNLLNMNNCSLAGCTINGTGVQANIKDVYYMELYANYLKSAVQNNDGKALTFSVDNVAESSYIALVIMYTDGTYLQKSGTAKSVTLWLDHQGRTVQHVLLRPMAKSDKFTDTTTVIKNLMLEFSDAPSDFEAYKGESYTPNADGTVEGITSVSPTMAILSDTVGATVEVEYNRDINVVIADILSRLNS